MPTVKVATGATIYYEEYGAGFPVLVFAGGGFNSRVDMWRGGLASTARTPYAGRFYDAIDELKGEFRVIAMDQRNAGRSLAPLEAPDWSTYARDQLGLLDALGIQRAFVLGQSIGSSFCFGIAREAPYRIVAAMTMFPMGYTGSDLDIDYVALQGFEEAARFAESDGMAAVVAKSKEHPRFWRAGTLPPAGPWGGPWVNHILADEAFARQVAAMPVDEYAALVRAYGGMFRGDFVLSVDEDWMRRCPIPIMIFPGDDPLHPRAVSERIRDLAPQVTYDVNGWWDLPASAERIRAFFRRHVP